MPFFPSSADRGFAPMRYDVVDEAFGTYEDIEAIGREYYLMFDFMVNHISSSSKYFQDFLKRKNESKYADFFIRYEEFWGNGAPTQEQLDKIYKRKPRAPYIEVEFQDGTTEKIWCTFCEEQIDLCLLYTSFPVFQFFLLLLCADVEIVLSAFRKWNFLGHTIP